MPVDKRKLKKDQFIYFDKLIEPVVKPHGFIHYKDRYIRIHPHHVLLQLGLFHTRYGYIDLYFNAIPFAQYDPPVTLYSSRFECGPDCVGDRYHRIPKDQMAKNTSSEKITMPMNRNDFMCIDWFVHVFKTYLFEAFNEVHDASSLLSYEEEKLRPYRPPLRHYCWAACAMKREYLKAEEYVWSMVEEMNKYRDGIKEELAKNQSKLEEASMGRNMPEKEKELLYKQIKHSEDILESVSRELDFYNPIILYLEHDEYGKVHSIIDELIELQEHGLKEKFPVYYAK